MLFGNENQTFVSPNRISCFDEFCDGFAVSTIEIVETDEALATFPGPSDEIAIKAGSDQSGGDFILGHFQSPFGGKILAPDNLLCLISTEKKSIKTLCLKLFSNENLKRTLRAGASSEN